MSKDSIQLTEWKQLTYYDPSEFLRGLRRAELKVRDSDLPPEISHLRTHGLRPHLEARQAALFALGISGALDTQVAFAMHESSDYDFVAALLLEGTLHFLPVQLKEWVPPDVNPDQSLQDVLDKLVRTYPTATRTTVAVHVNRPVHIEFAALKVPSLALGGLWLFGAAVEDQSEWLLYGSLLQEPRLYSFQYPGP